MSATAPPEGSVPIVEPLARAAVDERTQRLKLYLGGQASWFMSLGIQFVLFPYLVANLLAMPAALVGIAQMSLMAPSLFFMLLGGATADHADARSILIRVHLLATVPPLGLGVALASGQLSYTLLLIYALLMGTLGAFAIPARDFALSRVAGSRITQAVTLAMGTQLGAQLVGMLLAALAAATGAPALLFFQSAIMLAGAWASSQLSPLPPSAGSGVQGRLAQVREGIVVAWRIEIVFAVITVMLLVGIFYVGSFMVAIPLMVRDTYHGGVIEFSIVNVAFWGGTIVATFALLRAGPIARRGRLLLGAVATCVAVLVLLSITVPFWVLCLLSFGWGLCAGIVMTMGRTIVQLAAPDSHRARVLAFYQLGFSGGAPIGALAMGFLAGALGVHQALLVPAGCMLVITVLLGSFTSLWRNRIEPH